MKKTEKLLYVKLAHTAIWVLFVAIICYIFYSGVTNSITLFTWIGIGLVLSEGLVLLIYKLTCPLTILARRYSDSQKDNFDIFLPNWLAKWNKVIFSSIFIVGLLAVVF